LEERLRSAGEVAAVGISDVGPGGLAPRRFTPLTLDAAAVPKDAPKPPQAQLLAATSGYFEASGIPVIAGRRFTADDRVDSVDVVILSTSAARQLNPQVNDLVGRRFPLGQSFWGGVQSAAQSTAEIVGIVGTTRLVGATGDEQAQIYRPFAQSEYSGAQINVIVAAAQNVDVTIAAAQRVLREVDPQLPVYNILPIQDLRARFLVTERTTVILAAAFAAIALVLCGIGTYGILSQHVTQRTHEIGVRMAMGADRASLRNNVVANGIWFAALGSAVGAVGAFVAFRYVRHLVPIFSSPPFIPTTAAAALLFLLALLAAWQPASRASRIDPAEALRTKQ
jgi:putative ABC transport system permease protein